MKSYLITDPKYYTQEPSHFKCVLNGALKNSVVDFACFRDKSADKEQFSKLATIFVESCKENSIANIFIHSDYELALKLGVSGVHLGSGEVYKSQRIKEENLKLVVSTHSLDEIRLSERFGADYVTFSPIFETSNKGQPQGISKLKEMVESTHLPLFALGGIVSDENLKEIKPSGAFGFAAIRYFVMER